MIDQQTIHVHDIAAASKPSFRTLAAFNKFRALGLLLQRHCCEREFRLGPL